MGQRSHQQLKPEAIDLLERFPRPQVSSDGLVLYYHPHNYFSQKILIALYEKRIPFTTITVDISNGEQFSPWFLELNPKGEVPVLQNGVQIVPESSRILGYLEELYASDQYTRLLPRDLSAVVVERILQLNRQIGRLPIGAISMGVFWHPSVVGNAARPPFAQVTRNTIALTGQKVRQVLAQLASVQHPQADTLMRRVDVQEQKLAILEERPEFMRLLQTVHDLLDDIESCLSSQRCTWLCSEQFTVADLSLAVLLYRLCVLGLEENCWASSKRPLVAEYFGRVCERDSFRRSVEAQQSVMVDVPKTMADLVTAIRALKEVRLAVVWNKLTPGQVAAAATVLSAAMMMMYPLYSAAFK